MSVLIMLGCLFLRSHGYFILKFVTICIRFLCYQQKPYVLIIARPSAILSRFHSGGKNGEVLKLSSSSCLIAPVSNPVFFFACLLHVLRSLSQQKGPRLHSCRISCIVWFGLPHGHSLVGANPHLWRLLAVLPTLALALFSVTQSFLGRSVPQGSSSLGGWMALLSWLSHSVHVSIRCCGRSPG